jgi:hypothetical protein
MGALIVIMLWLGINILISICTEGKRLRNRKRVVRKRTKSKFYNVLDDYDEYSRRNYTNRKNAA